MFPIAAFCQFIQFQKCCPGHSALLTSNLQMHGAVHGEGQGQEVEGIKASADVATGLALHLGLELTVEQIDHYGAIPA